MDTTRQAARSGGNLTLDGPARSPLLRGRMMPGFGLSLDGDYHTATEPEWQPGGASEEREPSGTAVQRTHFVHYGLEVRATACARFFPGLPLLERWVEVENVGAVSRRLGRVDSIRLGLVKGEHRLRSYAGGWGQEFSPQDTDLSSATVIETRSGRSSNGKHPWFGLSDKDGHILTGAVAWPGNHIIRIEPEDTGWLLSGGLNDWEFSTVLAPGDRFRAPSVFLSSAENGDWDAAARAFHRWGRTYGYPKTSLAQALPMEWNHWWPYEDKAINDAVFRANIERAAAMGFQVVTLDAGWFGPSGETHWWDVRGDWDLVNQERFPNGVRPLADLAHARGLKFGLWCEIEALGGKAAVAQKRPDLPALRDGKPLGYACFGNPRSRDWAVETLDGVIKRCAADWIKIDFNVDPGAGCNRTDHGHGSGDGLYRHLNGLFDVVNRLRAKHPHVLFEGCSSGGLRIDLGWLQHVPCVFLSDPDYPAHNLQLFWGVLDYVAPSAALHWAWSENLGAFPSFKPDDSGLTDARLDYVIRTGLLGMAGFSQRLPDLPDRVAKRIERHIAVYRERIAPLVREADVFRLTGQPMRDGGGDRWCAFLYTMPDARRGALFVFRLTGGTPERTLRLKGLRADRRYTLRWDGTERKDARTGASLMEEGLTFSDLPEEGSALIFLEAG